MVLISEPKVFEYYDGLASGVLETRPKSYFVYLLAFDASRRLRRYVVIPIDTDQVLRLEEAMNRPKSRNGRQDQVKDLRTVRSLRNQMTLARWTDSLPKKGERLDLRDFGVDEIASVPPPTFPCVSRAAADEAVRRWLDN
jgi:hypothetical protein